MKVWLNLLASRDTAKIAEMHLKSLNRFDFASVLLPYSYQSLQDAQYADEFDQLYQICQEKQVAMQTIKSIAKKRWTPESTDKQFSWYEPLRDQQAIKNAVHFVLSKPGIFLNTTSDATLLKVLLMQPWSLMRKRQTGRTSRTGFADAAAMALSHYSGVMK